MKEKSEQKATSTYFNATYFQDLSTCLHKYFSKYSLRNIIQNQIVVMTDYYIWKAYRRHKFNTRCGY